MFVANGGLNKVGKLQDCVKLEKWLVDCVFWCTRVKWWHLLVIFSFFQNFDFLGCKGGE